MDTLTTFATTSLLAVTAAGLLVSSGFGARTAVTVLRERRNWVHSMRELMAELAEAADEFAARPQRAHRHNAHCPTCGRFARVTSEGDWGVRTVCTVHGRRLRATRRIGRVETLLIPVTAYRPLGGLDLPAPIVAPELPPRELEAPHRADWLDTGAIVLPAAA